eukprot:5760284-Amphidinium_carterae.2
MADRLVMRFTAKPASARFWDSTREIGDLSEIGREMLSAVKSRILVRALSHVSSFSRQVVDHVRTPIRPTDRDGLWGRIHLSLKR